MRRVLVLRPDHVGDVLLSAPAVARLRSSLPAAELTYLVGPWSAEAARYGPPVDRLLTLAFPGFTRRPNTNLLAPYVLLARTAAGLRRQRFDLAIVLRPDHWWGALLAQAAGVPYRVGTRTPETEALLTHARTPQPGEHWAAQALGVATLALEVLGQPVVDAPMTAFRVPEAAHADARRLLDGHGLDGARRLVGVQPSAGAILKSWPTVRWAALVDTVADELQAAVLLIGAPADAALLGAIARCARSRPAVQTGQSLGVSAALYARCRVLVAPDSGAAHLAAAVGTPTVRLYGPAAARVYGPWPARPDQRVLVTEQLACVPCGHLEAPPCGATTSPACLLAISPADVLHSVKGVLDRG